MSWKEVPLQIGEHVFLRGITHHYVGELVNKTDNWLVLKKAAWVPDDGRFADFLKTGVAEEFEPYPDETAVIISVDVICDISVWPFALPVKQK